MTRYTKMAICGPKLSVCGMVLGVWGVIMLVSFQEFLLQMHVSNLLERRLPGRQMLSHSGRI